MTHPVYDKQVRRRRAVLGLLVVVSLILLTAYFGESAGEPAAHRAARRLRCSRPCRRAPAARSSRCVTCSAGSATRRARRRSATSSRTSATDCSTEVVGLKRSRCRRTRSCASTLQVDENSLQDYDTRTVRVIGRPSNNLLLDRLEVDAGSSDGVRVGNPVVADGGLVGHVSFVAHGTGVRDAHHRPELQRVGEGARTGWGTAGLLKPSVGDPLDLLVQLLPRHARIRVSDIVVTAGFRTGDDEGLYPPNVPIGRVTKAGPGGARERPAGARRADRRPAASRLRADPRRSVGDVRRARAGGAVIPEGYQLALRLTALGFLTVVIQTAARSRRSPSSA